MLCGQIATCGCGFESDSLVIENNNGIISLETFGPAVVAAKEDVTSPFTWQQVFETTTGYTWTWDGTDWLLSGWTQAPACVLEMTTTQTIEHAGAGEEIVWDVEVFDPHGWHAASSTDIIPDLPGLYSFTIDADWQVLSDATRALVGPLINGTDLAAPRGRRDDAFAIAAAWSPRSMNTTSPWIELDGVTDVFSVFVFQQNNASATRTIRARMVLEWKAPI